MQFDEDEMGRRKDEEGSDLPDPKVALSTRLKGSILTKIDAIVTVRRTRAKEEGHPAHVVKAIDRHFVLNLVLPGALAEELTALDVDPEDDAKLYELAAAAAAAAEIEKKKAPARGNIDAQRMLADGRKHTSGH